MAVPPTLAEEMAEDFVQYQSHEDGAEQRKLYRYDREGDEVLVALDFSEIISLTATG